MTLAGKELLSTIYSAITIQTINPPHSNVLVIISIYKLQSEKTALLRISVMQYLQSWSLTFSLLEVANMCEMF